MKTIEQLNSEAVRYSNTIALATFDRIVHGVFVVDPGARTAALTALRALLFRAFVDGANAGREGLR